MESRFSSLRGVASPTRFSSRTFTDLRRLMKVSRRDMLKTVSLATAGATTGASAMGAMPAAAPQSSGGSTLPPAFDALKPRGSRVKPVTAEEYQQRIARAQQLMTDAKPQFQAIFIAPGTTLNYFTGIRWWPSERILALLIPRPGDP